MDLKTFAIGAACGAALYAVVANFVPPDRAADNPRASETVSDNQERVESASESSRLEGSSAAETSKSSEILVLRLEDANTESATPRARSDTTAPKIRAAYGVQPQPSHGDAERASDSPQTFVERAREKLLAEPKNITWAYDMEFAINQFLLNHPAAAEFEIPYAECRTTRCQVKAIGIDESTGPTWERVAFDMTRQPWYEFVQQGTSRAQVDGRHVIIMDLFTVPPSATRN